MGMTDPNIAQAPWEVKLHGFRRTQDGIVVSFVVHPNECPRALALDELGTRYGMALARIEGEYAPGTPQAPAGKQVAEKPHRHREDMPVGSQAALACKDVAFMAYLAHVLGRPILTESSAALNLRQHFIVGSRADIPDKEWADFYADFEQWAGRVTVPR